MSSHSADIADSKRLGMTGFFVYFLNCQKQTRFNSVL